MEKLSQWQAALFNELLKITGHENSRRELEVIIRFNWGKIPPEMAQKAREAVNVLS